MDSFNWAELAPVIWLAVGIIFAVAEGMTVQLVGIWFAIGAAVVALITAVGNISFAAQCWIFLLLSALLLVCTRPFLKKILTRQKEHTNADRVIGSVGLVKQEINNLNSAGRVFVMGLTWTARSQSGSIIPENEQVRVLAIDGVKLIVEPATNEIGGQS